MQSLEFLRLIVDSITEHIVVLDARGRIVFTNDAWNEFGQRNDAKIDTEWIGVDYLSACDNAAAHGDDFGRSAADGIRAVIAGEPEYRLEYPCHSPEKKRWFMMTVTGIRYRDAGYILITHLDITERKLAEEYALNLSRKDGLTGLFNRRSFDDFLAGEWNRCMRLGVPLTLAILDIDFFKLLNDTYGHQAGDDCLVKLGGVLAEYGKRPGDIAARIGGEEFALLFGNTPIADIVPILREISGRVHALAIPNERSPVTPRMTVSIGAAQIRPERGSSADELVRAADEQLYRAKNAGRDRIEYGELPG